MPRPVYVTTSIPYVNAAPHLGYALELVLADALARYNRLAGAPTRLQSGTDDNALKNVLAAERQGVPVAALVDSHAAEFERLPAALHVAGDHFIRTSGNPAHQRGAGALWRACAERGDLYRREYRGLYCTGCECFYTEDELADGRCPIHGTVPELVDEENWFFRLSRYEDDLLRLFDSGRLRILPETRLREARSFVSRGLTDFSVSRSQRRARGWGVPVPGDPGQVMYVWFDALANYVSGLGYPAEGGLFETFWRGAGRRIHVIGKDIIRFHAVYWPAMLLSAGLPVPDTILVHGFLQQRGAKLAKSTGVLADPFEISERLGAEPLRYWLLRAVGQGGDADWAEERAIDLRTSDLANELGNLLQRTVSMIRLYCDGVVPEPGAGLQSPLEEAAAGLPQRLQVAVADELDPQAALVAIWDVVRAANRHVNEARPWHLARSGERARLDCVLAGLAETLRIVAEALRPFLPATAGAIAHQLGVTPAATGWLQSMAWSGRASGATTLGDPVPLFPRLP